MMHITFQYRPDSENRLCGMSPTAPGGGPSSAPSSGPSSAPVDSFESFGRWAGEKFAWFGSFMKDLGGDVFVTVPSSFWQTLKKEWDFQMPSENDARNFLEDSKKFFAGAPESLKRVFEGLVDPRIETLRQLQNDRLWTAAFRDPNILSAAKEPLKGPLYGPQEYLLSLDPARRAELFYDYTTARFIPEDIQKKYEAVFGRDPKKRAEFIAANAGRFATVQNSIGDLLGDVDDVRRPLMGADDDARLIAKDTLKGKFLKDRSKNAGDLLPDGKYNITYDLKGSLAHYGAAFGPQSEAEIVPEAFASKINVSPHSFLKGALLLGVVDKAGLQRAYAEASEELSRITKGSSEVASSNRDDAQESERRNAIEARTVSQMWRRMSGVEKLILVVGALWAMKSAPGVGLALGAVYFGQKLFMKQDKPIEGWGRVISGIVGSIGAPLKKFGIGEQFKSSNIDEHAKTMNRFVPLKLREEADKTAKGFAKLSCVKMRELADAFEFEEGALTGTLDVEKLIPIVERDANGRNWDASGVSEFFRDPKNLKDVVKNEKGDIIAHTGVADGIATLFYLVGTEHFPGKEKVRIVENAMKTYDNYDAIPANLVVDGIIVRRAFEEIAFAGESAAATGELGEMTLGAYAEKVLSTYTTHEPSMESEKIDIESDAKYLRLKNEIENYTYKSAPANLKVMLDKAANTVTVDVGGTKYPLPISMPIPEFLAYATGKDVIDRWVAEGWVKKEADLRTKSLARWASPLVMTKVGEGIQYHANILVASVGRAETSVYTFMSSSFSDIEGNYTRWYDTNWGPGTTLPVGVSPTDKDPF